MAEKNTAPDSLRGTTREYLREQDRTNELLADIAGVEYVSPGDPPKTGYMIEKRLLDAAQKKNELLDDIATGGGGGSASTLGLSIDYATDVISLKKSGEPISGSGATLPAYGVSFDPTTGGLTLTKNGTAVQGQTVTIPNYGSPVGVTASSAMTDHDTIYLYEGTTGGGYTNGHFYYWDGTAWADGGEYAAATVQTDKTLLVEDRAADAKATGEAIGDLKTQLSEKVESAFVTDDLSGSTTGLTIEEVDGDLQIYGTATSTRRICWLNGQSGSKTTGSAFDKTLDAGMYEISANCTGGRTSFRIDGTYSTFSDAFVVCSNENKNVTVTFTNPVMIGFYVNTTDPNWGTSENPSLLTFSAKRIIAKDVVARKDIDILKQYDAVHSPAYQNEFAGILKGYPSFVFNSDNSITVTIPAIGHGRAIYTGGIITDANGTSERIINVPKNNYFVYDSVNKDFAVRSLNDILVTDITCFFTTGSGGMVGNWLSYLAVDTANDTKDIVSENELIDIPEYYNTNNYLSDKIGDIREIGFGLSTNSARFVFITDYHLPSNTGNSPALAKKIMRETGITELYFNGDYNNKENTPLGGYNVLCDFMNDMKPLEYGSHVYYTTGNHEYNDPSGAESNLRIDRAPIFQLFNAYNKNIVSINPDATNAYYVDYPDAKIRIYGIDCNYQSEITPTTRKYMYDSLLQIPEGYAVFLTSHVGKGASSSETLSSRFAQIMECCAALNDGTSVSFSLGSPFGTVTYDFAGKARTFIGAITGHTHVDGYVIYDNRFPVIITECDRIDNDHAPNKVVGTITEQAFDVVQIDVTNQRIYCTRIGDGSDRTFSFGTGAGLIT